MINPQDLKFTRPTPSQKERETEREGGGGDREGKARGGEGEGVRETERRDKVFKKNLENCFQLQQEVMSLTM